MVTRPRYRHSLRRRTPTHIAGGVLTSPRTCGCARAPLAGGPQVLNISYVVRENIWKTMAGGERWPVCPSQSEVSAARLRVLYSSSCTVSVSCVVRRGERSTQCRVAVPSAKWEAMCDTKFCHCRPQFWEKRLGTRPQPFPPDFEVSSPNFCPTMDWTFPFGIIARTSGFVVRPVRPPTVRSRPYTVQKHPLNCLCDDAAVARRCARGTPCAARRGLGAGCVLGAWAAAPDLRFPGIPGGVGGGGGGGRGFAGAGLSVFMAPGDVQGSLGKIAIWRARALARPPVVGCTGSPSTPAASRAAQTASCTSRRTRRRPPCSGSHPHHPSALPPRSPLRLPRPYRPPHRHARPACGRRQGPKAARQRRAPATCTAASPAITIGNRNRPSLL
eukprot:gene4569-biopygen5473